MSYFVFNIRNRSRKQSRITGLSHFVCSIIVLVLLIGPVSRDHKAVAATIAPASTTALPEAAMAADVRQTAAPKVRINEIAPVAGPDKPAWIELSVELGAGPPTGLGHHTYLPLLSSESSGPAAPVSATSVLSHGGWIVLPAGYRLSDFDGNEYSLPAISGNYSGKEISIIVFLGSATPQQGQIQDGVVVLHSTLPAGAFAKDGDDLALFAPASAGKQPELIDYVAWGRDPGASAQIAIAKGLWSASQYLTLDDGFGAEGEPAPYQPNQSFGRWSDSWASYGSRHSSPGKPNPMPSPMSTTVPDGAILDATTFGVAWSPVDGATQYEFQLDVDEAFVKPTVNIKTMETGWRPKLRMQSGKYYWRVRALTARGDAGGWTGPFQINHVPALDLANPNGQSKVLLTPQQYRIQRKDTTMLDIGGGPGNTLDGNPIGSSRFGLRTRWDGPHILDNGAPSYSTSSGLDSMYCARASAAMITAYYGANLSLDRLAYYVFEQFPGDDMSEAKPIRGVPENDLGYDKGMNPRPAVVWGLRIENSDFIGIGFCPVEDGYTCKHAGAAPISFELIKQWIDEGRPFISINLNGVHARVVDGYHIDPNGKRFIHLLDPAPNGCDEDSCTGVKWMDFESFRDTHEGTQIVSLAAKPNPRDDEPTLNLDSDGDGINDFDEVVRFKTNPNNKDTDGDFVNDKEDIAEYVFNAANKYSKREADLSYNADFPDYGEPSLFVEDVLRKEVDPDNDNDGVPDGCEDNNRDGRRDFGAQPPESDNFSPTSNGACQARLTLLMPSTSAPASIASAANPGDIVITLQLEYPPALKPTPSIDYDAGQFLAAFERDGSTTPSLKSGQVKAVNVSGGVVALIVRPPTQISPGVFDLIVRHNASDQVRVDKAVIYAGP